MTEHKIKRKPSVPSETVAEPATLRAEDDAKTDAIARDILRAAHERSVKPMSTEKSIREGNAYMEQMRKNSAIALAARIERKELITAEELRDRLGITRRSISDAARTGRLFAIVGASGDNYYPAFYADKRYDRRALEKVSKALGTLPGAVKYHFFTSKSTYLRIKSPLEALEEGRLADVLIAAAGFAER
jgi:hypothetical protein